MDSPDSTRVTKLLGDWREGRAEALDELTPLIVPELRRLAAHYMGRERASHTLQPTALINEAYLRMAGNAVEWQSRAHFVAIAATHMRRILVDHARNRKAAKRGAGANAVTLDDAHAIAGDGATDLMALDEALEKLGQIDQRKQRAIEMKFFGGMEHAEIAEVLGIHPKTVENDIRFAKAWLRSALSPGK